MRLLMCSALLLLTTTARAEEPKKEDEEAKAKAAALRAEVLVKAAQTYYVQHVKWPMKLIEIAPLLENGQKDLLDPWGKEYQFQIREKEANGEDRVYIWTVHTVGKETKVYGKKPPEEKKPEDKKP